MHPSHVKKSLYYGLFRLLAHEYLLEPSLHSCSSSRFSTTYSKTPISTDSEIVCEMGVIVYEMGVIVCEIGVFVCEMGISCARWVFRVRDGVIVCEMVTATNWNL